MKSPPPTGHPVVDAIGRLELIGPLIPYAWFTKILDERGRPYHLAILVLAEIVGWYQPKVEIEKDGSVVAHQRFNRSRLHINRGDLARKFNTDEDTITKALTFLEKSLGAIGRRLADLVIAGKKHRNCLFVWPVPEVIEKLGESDDPENEAEVAPIKGDTWPSSQGPHTPYHGGDVAASKVARGPDHGGDVAPVMRVGTVTQQKSDRTTTATANGSRFDADAPVVVVAAANEFSGKSPAGSPVNAPEALSFERKENDATLSQANGAPRQNAGQVAEGKIAGTADASREAGAVAGEADAKMQESASRFLEFFQNAHKAKFKVDGKVSKADRDAVRNLIRQENVSTVLLSLILCRAWNLICKVSPNGYPYPASQHSQKLSKFTQHFETICSDTGSKNVRNMPIQKAVLEIAKLTGLDLDRLNRGGSQSPEPEMRFEAMPKPGQTGGSLKAYVSSRSGIPLVWVTKELIPYLAEQRGEVSDGKLAFLLAYWTLWKKHEGCWSADPERDYVEVRDCDSSRFEDANVRAKLAEIIDSMLQQYRRSEQASPGERPVWPIMSNVLQNQAVIRLLCDAELPQSSATNPTDDHEI